MLYCSSCQSWKDEDDFYESVPECRECKKARSAQWNEGNRERRRAINRESEERRRAAGRQPEKRRGIAASHKQAMPITIDGVVYPSRAAAARALGVHYRRLDDLADAD